MPRLSREVMLLGGLLAAPLGASTAAAQAPPPPASPPGISTSSAHLARPRQSLAAPGRRQARDRRGHATGHRRRLRARDPSDPLPKAVVAADKEPASEPPPRTAPEEDPNTARLRRTAFTSAPTAA